MIIKHLFVSAKIREDYIKPDCILPVWLLPLMLAEPDYVTKRKETGGRALELRTTLDLISRLLTCIKYILLLLYLN